MGPGLRYGIGDAWDVLCGGAGRSIILFSLHFCTNYPVTISNFSCDQCATGFGFAINSMWCNWTTFVGWLCQFWLFPFFNSILFACLDSRRKKSSNSMFVVWEAWRHISEMQRIYCRISTICHIDNIYSRINKL